MHQQKSPTPPPKKWRPQNDDLQGWVYQILHPCEPRETRRSEASDHHRNTKSTEALVKNYDHLDIPVSKKLLGYNLLIYGVYWGYNPFTNHLLTSWDIQVGMVVWFNMRTPEWMNLNIPPNLWFVWAIVDMKICEITKYQNAKMEKSMYVLLYMHINSQYTSHQSNLVLCRRFPANRAVAEICHCPSGDPWLLIRNNPNNWWYCWLGLV